MENEALRIGPSRIHAMHGYFDMENLFVKRDDELGLGIGGSKARKYRGLIEEAKKHELTIIEGSAHSNNSIGLIPLLKQEGIKLKLVLPKISQPKHNALWLFHLLDKDEITYLPDNEKYPNQNWLKKTFEEIDYFLIPEGAHCSAAFYSLQSLPEEIKEYQAKKEVGFDDIFIDSGSGITALALAVGMISNTPLKKVPKIHICLMAGSKEEFVQKAENLLDILDENMQLNKLLEHLNFFRPVTSKAFGSVNKTMVNEWKKIMLETGIPIDLTYTAKHFATIKNMFSENRNYFSRRVKLIINSCSWFAIRNHEQFLSIKLQEND